MFHYVTSKELLDLILQFLGGLARSKQVAEFRNADVATGVDVPRNGIPLPWLVELVDFDPDCIAGVQSVTEIAGYEIFRRDGGRLPPEIAARFDHIDSLEDRHRRGRFHETAGTRWIEITDGFAAQHRNEPGHPNKDQEPRPHMRPCLPNRTELS